MHQIKKRAVEGKLTAPFLVAGRPTLIRARLYNLTVAGGWEPTGSGGFRQFEPRSLSLNLAMDF